MTDAYERAKADDEAWEREHGDSREKIERDARVIADNLMMYGGKSTFGAYDIIALLDRQAAITEREWLEGKTHIFGMTFDEVHSLKAKVDELNAQNTRLNAKWAEANVLTERLLAERGSEPFCSQVKRWLNGDAPQECRECGDGCYRELCEAFGVKHKRTIEDVLATFRFDAKNIYDDPTLNGNERVDELEALDADVAAELRGMGVCDE